MSFTMNNPHWEYISFFESHDYVARRYKEWHEREPNASRIKQINACFSQGLEYFTNAERAAMSVKPLLLYYGVLSLCRGLILAKNPNKSEASLSQGHGLEVFNWEQTLAGGIGKILELQIRATRGTFRELVEISWHLNSVKVFQGASDQMGSNGHNLGEVKFAIDKSTLTLDDLISRLKYTGFQYSRITEKPAKVHHTRIASHPPDRIDLAFPLMGVPEEFKNLVDGDKIRIGSSNKTAPGFRQSDDAEDCLIFTNSDWEMRYEMLPAFHYESGEFMSVIQDFSNGDKLTEFIKLYLVSYVLGMIVRYFPSKWISLLRNDKGDLAYPLIVSAAREVEVNFAEEFSKQLNSIPRKISNGAEGRR